MDNKLESEFKAKWLEALRSGEYKQAKDSLYVDNIVDDETNEYTGECGYCCLGVAGAICGVPIGVLNGRGLLYDLDKVTTEYNIPAILAQPFAVNEKGEKTDSYNGQHTIAGTLANMNDRGETFAEIADWIEDNL